MHIGIVDNTSQRHDQGGSLPTLAMYLNVRARMERFGVRPSELAIITDIATYIKSQGMDQFTTLEKFGPMATILTGQLGAINGIPVIVSEQMLPADTDGKVSDAGNGSDRGRVMIVNRSQYRCGYRRELMLESERDIQRRQTVLVPSMRIAFEGRRNDNDKDQAMAVAYNVG